VRSLNLIVICVVICSFPASGDETIYRWTNDSGQVFFGDTPPMNSQAERQKINPASDSGKRAARSGLRPGELTRLYQIRTNEKYEAAEKFKRDKQRIKREASKTRKAEAEKKACNRYRNRIREIDARLRHGCRAAKCARLNEQRNKYKRKTSDLC
jgi:pyruvate-formate lyase